MNELNENLEKRLRLLDPTLSANKYSDLYSETIKYASIQSDDDPNEFAIKITGALQQVYGRDWLLNPNLSEQVVTDVLYGCMAKPSSKIPSALEENSAWYDGNICRFITCSADEIPQGKTYYVRDDKDQKLIFESVIKKETLIRVNFSVNLSIEIDETGRLLYPAHVLDNLFLEEQKSTEVKLPHDILKGRAYILEPSTKILEEYSYFNLEALGSLYIDKQRKLLQFGDHIGQRNIEIVSGFVLSFTEDKLVNAWLRLENIS